MKMQWFDIGNKSIIYYRIPSYRHKRTKIQSKHLSSSSLSIENQTNYYNFFALTIRQLTLTTDSKSFHWPIAKILHNTHSLFNITISKLTDLEIGSNIVFPIFSNSWLLHARLQITRLELPIMVVQKYTRTLQLRYRCVRLGIYEAVRQGQDVLRVFYFLMLPYIAAFARGVLTREVRIRFWRNGLEEFDGNFPDAIVNNFFSYFV